MKSKSVEGGRTMGRLRRFWSGRTRIRLPLTLALAVMLPAAALICVNFYHLKSIERDKALEAAIHRDFQQMLAISEKQINHKAYTIVEELRDLFPSPDADKEAKVCTSSISSCQSTPRWRTCSSSTQTRGFILRSQPRQMSDRYFDDEHHRLEKTFAGWLSLEGKTMLETARKKRRPVTWYGERTKRDGALHVHDDGLFPLAARRQGPGCDWAG